MARLTVQEEAAEGLAEGLADTEPCLQPEGQGFTYGHGTPAAAEGAKAGELPGDDVTEDAAGGSKDGSADGGLAVAAADQDGIGEQQPPGVERGDEPMDAALALDAASAAPTGEGAAGGDWLVFNDFCVMPSPLGEVLDVYGGQKVPCLLLYTQVDPPPHHAPEDALSLQPRAPCVTEEGFVRVCAMPPLQVCVAMPETGWHVPEMTAVVVAVDRCCCC